MQKLTKYLLLATLMTFLFIGCSSKPKPLYSYQLPFIPIKFVKYDNGEYEVEVVPELNIGIGTIALEDS